MFARMNCGPVRTLSRLTEFALRVFVVKLLMGSISHNASPAVQIKIDINSPAENCRLPGGSRDGVYLQTNSSINNWLLAGQTEMADWSTLIGREPRGLA